MNKLFISLSLLFGFSFLFAASACQLDKNSPKAILKNVDAVQAMAIANEWKWFKKEIKSHVTTRDVVFELSRGVQALILGAKVNALMSDRVHVSCEDVRAVTRFGLVGR